MKAAIYSRKSKFTGKGESIENQVQMCKEYTKNMDICDYIIYEDEGFSGGSIERPEFQKMLEDARKKNFDILICYRLDRVSRNIADFSNLIEELQSLNIGFISIREQFDTSTPMGRAMMYIASVFAQLERETIAERVRDNMLELSKSGRWLGGNPPLGFKSELVTYIDENMNKKKMYKLLPIDEELNLVKLIYEKYLELGSIFKVTKYLDAHNIKLKNYYYANSAYISDILENPVYATASQEFYDYFSSQGATVIGDMDNIHGIMPYNRRTSGRRSVKYRKPKNQWILAVGKHKGIISGNMWVKVQKQKEANKSNAPNLGKCGVASLTGILRCDICGSPMIIRYGVRRKDGTRLYYYYCSQRVLNIDSCSNPSINSEVLEKVIIENLKDMTSSKNHILKLLLSKYNMNSSEKIKSDMLDLQKSISQNEIQIQNLVEQSSLLSVDASKFLLQKIEDLTKQNIELKSKLKELHEITEQEEFPSLNLDILLKTLTQFSDAICKCSTLEEKRNIFSNIVNRIYWNGKNKEAKIELLNL